MRAGWCLTASILCTVPVVACCEASPLTTGKVELVRDGFQFTEGPVWLPGEGLLFSDIPADTIYRADGSTFLTPSGKSNGLTLDTQGRLVLCQHWERRVIRIETDGAQTVLADRYQGKRLNSPNDAVVRSDGRIFFTDPPYGLEGREQELDVTRVYTIAPSGEVTAIVEDFESPNGIGLSPDENTLYVADTQRGHLRAFQVAPDGTVSNGRIFCEVPHPDGMAVDAEGRIWATSSDGVVVFDPAGQRLATITVPRQPANCGFGGSDGDWLYITARTAVYRIQIRDFAEQSEP